MRSPTTITVSLSADDRQQLIAELLTELKPIIAASAEPRLVDGDRMAELAGVSRPTIDRAVRDGIIPSVRIGRRRLYEPRAVIDAWAAGEGASHD